MFSATSAPRLISVLACGVFVRFPLEKTPPTEILLLGEDDVANARVLGLPILPVGAAMRVDGAHSHLRLAHLVNRQVQRAA